MDVKAPKGSHQGKKSKTRTEEKFARKFPYRFSWLTETNAEPLQPWEVTKMSSSLREQLPLQKTLVPTRSIPVRGRENSLRGSGLPAAVKERSWDSTSGPSGFRSRGCAHRFGTESYSHSPHPCQPG
ncbi:uncharacterized protein C3orf22 homolog isoform X2 [Balaenoptera ricei]|uniref:uncharacterized protein C3orf22 homolog isoform X2 n=1 Tax=Balaenoptera ricei TaxID=2746895 RepID=UPI0028BD2892|nr:uncharacterized protein C3orf22 homolog isoform X2 [Balaenoptera ricei]